MLWLRVYTFVVECNPSSLIFVSLNIAVCLSLSHPLH